MLGPVELLQEGEALLSPVYRKRISSSRGAKRIFSSVLQMLVAGVRPSWPG